MGQGNQQDIVWGTKGERPAKAERDIEVYPDCYHIKGINTRKKRHQTEKPVELLEKLIAVAPDNGTVLDCFMGSGSTGVACVNTDRNFIGIELSPGYFTTAQNSIRLKN